MASTGIRTGRTLHGNNINIHTNDTLFHQAQVDGLCGMHAINNVLQEKKCIYVPDPEYQQIEILRSNMTTGTIPVVIFDRSISIC